MGEHNILLPLPALFVWQCWCLTLEVPRFNSSTLLKTIEVYIIFILYSTRCDIQEQFRAPLPLDCIRSLVLYEAINFYHRHLMTPQIHHMWRWWKEIHTHWVLQLVKSHGYLTSALISVRYGNPQHWELYLACRT